MNVVESLKNYFAKKSNNQETGKAPEYVCPNCWGNQEWDGAYYTFMKGHNGNPSDDIYNNFIQDIARKLDKITVDKNSHTCETCSVD